MRSLDNWVEARVCRESIAAGGGSEADVAVEARLPVNPDAPTSEGSAYYFLVNLIPQAGWLDGSLLKKR